jgi:hypothetical protein
MITADDARIAATDALDVRFPMSRLLDGSDAMPDRDGRARPRPDHVQAVLIEYVDRLHEHFLDPVAIDGGRYRVPSRPGDSAQTQPVTLSRSAFAAAAEWAIGKE